MKILSACIASICVLSGVCSAEIADADFKKAFEKYLATEQGQEQIGGALKTYMQKEQERAQKEQEARQEAELEKQFKNPIKIEIGDAPTKGPDNAKVTIVEFSDFECPYCSRGASTIEALLKEYPNDVRVAFKNLPLPFHKNAEPAARAALAAGKQGKFWEMHDVLFANQKQLNEALYEAEAKKLGLDMKKFKADYESEELKKQVEGDAAQARKIGISGTPGFSVNGVLVKGAYPVPHFKKIIDRWLAK